MVDTFDPFSMREMMPLDSIIGIYVERPFEHLPVSLPLLMFIDPGEVELRKRVACYRLSYEVNNTVPFTQKADVCSRRILRKESGGR